MEGGDSMNTWGLLREILSGAVLGLVEPRENFIFDIGGGPFSFTLSLLFLLAGLGTSSGSSSAIYASFSLVKFQTMKYKMNACQTPFWKKFMGLLKSVAKDSLKSKTSSKTYVIQLVN